MSIKKIVYLHLYLNTGLNNNNAKANNSCK